MDRRGFLKLVGGLAGTGLLGRYALLPPPRSRSVDGVDALALALFDSLDGEARQKACVDYDHPLRQYHNRGVWGGGLWINSLTLGWEQRRMLTDLFYAGLSPAGQERAPREFFTQIPGIHAMKLLICGEPSSPPYQVILTGPHLNLRLGGRSREGAAFGGPLVYGDQRGNMQKGLPGNLYRYQFEIGRRLFRSLSAEQRRLALFTEPPIQTQIGLQGREGTFLGPSIGSLSKESRAIARELIEAILGNYPSDEVAYAWECLEKNGGPEGLFLSYYRQGEVDQSGEHQIFRLEGPAAVFYFRGFPHVHAFINVAMDGDAPLSVGEIVGYSPTVLRDEGVKRFFEEALRDQSGTDLAYFDRDSVAGVLRKGPIRSGDIYALESWQDSIVEVLVKGSNLGPAMVAELRSRGMDIAPGLEYSIATTGHVVDEAADKLGKIERRREGMMVRDAAVAYLKKQAFNGSSSSDPGRAHG